MDPQVLLEEVAWIEVDTEGDPVLKVYSGETFQPYSSVIIQSAIVMLMPLLFLWAYQAASERCLIRLGGTSDLGNGQPSLSLTVPN